jgi:hypothetical protein
LPTDSSLLDNNGENNDEEPSTSTAIAATHPTSKPPKPTNPKPFELKTKNNASPKTHP